MMTDYTKVCREDEKDIMEDLFQKIFYLHRTMRTGNPHAVLPALMQDLKKHHQSELMPPLDIEEELQYWDEARQTESAFKQSVRRTNRRRHKLFNKVLADVEKSLEGAICY